MIYPIRADERKCPPLVVRAGADPAKLREYSYAPWNGEWYIRTGWGQDAGRVTSEEEARLFCQYVRDCMTFDGRMILMGKTLTEWLKEHEQAEKVMSLLQYREAAQLWGVEPHEARRCLLEEYKAGRLPLWLTRAEWQAWLMSDHADA